MWKSGASTFFSIVCLCLPYFLMCRPATAREGLLPNGNFERAPRVGTAEEGSDAQAVDFFPKWQVRGNVEYVSAGQKRGASVLAVPQGGHAVRLGREGQISQTIRLKTGSLYSLTFSASRACAQPEGLSIYAPPTTGKVPIHTIYSSNGWDTYAWAFKAYTPTVDLVFHNQRLDGRAACGPILDAIAIKEIAKPKTAPGNLVVNGDFEEGPYAFRNGSSGVLLPHNVDPSRSPLPGWIVESSKAVKYIDSEHFAVPRGRGAVELLAGKECVLSQTVRTVSGRDYRLSFRVGDASNKCNGTLALEVYVGRQKFRVPYESRGTGGYRAVGVAFKATSPGTRIAFMSRLYSRRTDDLSSLCGPVVDDVRVARHGS